MPLIPEPILDEIQSRVDIAELISRYVPLKRAGRHFKALCPFHHERTPSFHVNTDKQIFHCFGCGVGGNVFSFVMQQERLTFPEAARRLAEEARVPIPAAEGLRNGQTNKQLEVLEKTCRYYERCLAHPQRGLVARTYLAQRGVTERARETFRLGCAPGGWDHLVQAAARSKLSLDLLQQAGLALSGSRGPVDRFRNRLMFPIQDARGRVVGFGGRSLAGQDPKYVNSPETPVYHKGQQLFGLFQAKDAIVNAKAAVVVEGYFDCVMLWQAGIEHVVSPLGTAFTPEQAKKLSRYTDRVILAFDADAAGEAATLRGIDVLIEAGLHVQVAQLPSGVDPDELVQAHGAEAFDRLTAGSFNVVEFLIACAKARYRASDPEGKTRAAQFVLPTLAKVPNAILRAEYVRLLADRLDLDERSVMEALKGVQPRHRQGYVAAEEPKTARSGAERLLTALILEQPARWERVKARPLLEHMCDSRLKRLLTLVVEMRAMEDNAPTPVRIISRVGDQELAALVSELVQLAQSVSAKERAFEESVQRILADARKRQLAQLREQLRIAQEAGRDVEVTRLLEDYQRLVKGARHVVFREAETGIQSR